MMEITPIPENTLPTAVRDWIHTIGWTHIDSYSFNAPPVELKAVYGDGWKHFAPNTHCTVTICNGTERHSQKFDMTVEGWCIDDTGKQKVQ